MRDVLIASAILGLLFAALFVLNRKNGTEERPVEQPPHPDRLAYEAEVAKAEHDHLSPADEATVADLHAFVEEIGTGEQRMLVPFDLDPLAAPIPDDRDFSSPDLFHDVTAGWLSMFTWTAAPDTAVALSSVQVFEPDPLELESFTTGWSRSEMDAILAKGKAAAR